MNFINSKPTQVLSYNHKQRGHLYLGTVSCLAASPDDKYIISGSGRSIKVFEFDPLPNSYSGSFDNSMASQRGLILGMKEVYQFNEAHQKDYTIRSLAISPDGKYLISGSDDRSIKIFDFETKQELKVFEKVHDGGSCKYGYDVDS